jgi:hypothetical protein
MLGASRIRVFIQTIDGLALDHPAVAEVRDKIAAAVPHVPIELGSAPSMYDIVEGIEEEDFCMCGWPIVSMEGEWLHLDNPTLTGTDDHHATRMGLTDALPACLWFEMGPSAPWKRRHGLGAFCVRSTATLSGRGYCWWVRRRVLRR